MSSNDCIAKHTPALRATPLDRGDPNHGCPNPLYEEGCPQGGVCRVYALWLVAAVSGLFLFAGCQAPVPVSREELLAARFFLEARPDRPGHTVQLPVSGVAISINLQPVLVEHDITKVEVATVDLGRCLYFQLSPSAAHDFHRMSAASVGRRLVLTLNDHPAGVRVIDQVIADGGLLIFVEVPDQELPGLAARLNRTAVTFTKRKP